MLNKLIHQSDDAEMYLQAPLDKSSEKFAIFSVKKYSLWSSLLSTECCVDLVNFLPLCCLHRNCNFKITKFLLSL